MVKSVEGDTTEPTRIGPMLGGSTMSVVKVTALGSPLNTGQRVDYHASANTMNDINEVKIKELNGGPLTVGTRYMGQFSGYDSYGKPVFIVNLGTSGGVSISVVTDVVCTPTGLEVTSATLSGADSFVANNFLSLVDVSAGTYLGNANRVVKVNSTATGLTFGAITDSTASTFIGLVDAPAVYGSTNTYKPACVAASNAGLEFRSNLVTTQASIVGGGNPCSPSFVSLYLVNDNPSPGNYYAYSTNSAGVKGWNLQAATPAGLTVGGNVVVSARKASVADVAAHTISSAGLATTASSTQTAINDLTTQLNLLLARIRSHGLIS